ncbi:hypothetical protein [Phaffia rhodozyma]|uniref:Uncharacterized protein n=1 Tax=Phaffia rhodozyma TaxID=264483 RepID=A0A0F7SVG1_PHARH|nr:hypothetical protein [Phaffia rhodozyma]
MGRVIIFPSFLEFAKAYVTLQPSSFQRPFSALHTSSTPLMHGQLFTEADVCCVRGKKRIHQINRANKTKRGRRMYEKSKKKFERVKPACRENRERT